MTWIMNGIIWYIVAIIYTLDKQSIAGGIFALIGQACLIYDDYKTTKKKKHF